MIRNSADGGEGNMSAAIEKPLIENDPKARFRNAPRRVDFTIDQDWRRYTPAEHERWDRLFKRSQGILRDRACEEFVAMIEKLTLSESGIPDMEQLSDRLAKLTGWRVVPVRDSYPTTFSSTILPIAAFRPAPSSALKPRWIICRSPTYFTTFSGTFRCWPIRSTPISCRPTVKAATARWRSAAWPIWRGSTGTRSNSG
jgi:hypothetical protein